MLKKTYELTQEDFETFPIWAEYYEPDDIDVLGRLGYDRNEIQNELEKIKYSDDYSFPIAITGANEAFQHMFFAINATLPCGKILKGYCSSRKAFAIILFHNTKKYSFPT